MSLSSSHSSYKPLDCESSPVHNMEERTNYNPESDPDTQNPQKDSKGLHLYTVLEIDKKATEDDIKKSYRKLALKYHPDKNLDGDPEKTEKFKEINYANTVLSNPKKRAVYDELGDTGLKLMEQFGEDNETILNWMVKPWFKYLFCGFGIITLGFFCCCCGCMCCCKCCCNFCCGKYVPKDPEDVYQASDVGDLEGDENNPPIIIAQPGPSNDTSRSSPIAARGPNGEEPVRPAVIAMPPPSTPSTAKSNDYGSTHEGN
ncbi:unnamed protein product [Auanema sp. JU1783]|nr:unnamed protein product [Auanema sp. JU1783]